MTRVLLVEDDRALRTGLSDALAGEGFDVTDAGDGEKARALLGERHFDLVVLDLMLPGRSGLEILRELRARGEQIAVLILTAKGNEDDRVLGLELGADDYVTKPFSLRELLARVRALVRRAGRGAPPAAPQRLRIGAADVDLGAFEIELDGKRVPLSPKEAAMLALLGAQRGSVVSRDRFLDEVWGGERLVGHRTIDTHVLNLRAKLEPDPKNPRWLLTVHGAGYRLAPEEGA
jgi:two-component system response regulator VicR